MENEVKIGTEKEAFYTEIMDSSKAEIEKYEKLLQFNKDVIEMCEAKIKAEQ